jgi:hypothetical protein
MPTEFLKLKVNDFGQVILPASDPEGRKAFFVEFFQTPIGKRLASFGVTEETENRISEILEKRFGDHEVTLEQLSAVIEQLIAIRDPAIVPAEPEPAAVVDNRPRHADGTFKHSFQIFTETHSSRECSALAETNRDYAEWRREQMRRQTAQEGAFKIVGAPTRVATDADRQVLGEFVKLYNAVPAQQLKPRGGFIVLDDAHRYNVQQFEHLIEQASAVGLL